MSAENILNRVGRTATEGVRRNWRKGIVAAGVAGFALSSTVGCGAKEATPPVSSPEQSYKYVIEIDLTGKLSKHPHTVYLFTNTEPLLIQKDGHNLLRAMNVFCPKANTSLNNELPGINSDPSLLDLGCTSEHMKSYNIATDQTITVIEQ